MIFSRIALPLAFAALAAPALAQSDIGNLEPAERSALRAEIRAYLLENPEVIYEAIQILEERRNAATAETDAGLVRANAKALFEDGYSFVGGNPDGDVTMVEFLDYRCGYCKKAHPAVQQVVKDDPNLRYVVKEFPILGPDSLAAARMAMAALALDPGKFAALNDELMRFEGGLTEEAAYRIAEDQGYDVDALREAAAAEEITARIKQNYELANALGINGTPGFVIGDQVIRGYVPAEDLAAAIAATRESASN